MIRTMQLRSLMAPGKQGPADDGKRWYSEGSYVLFVIQRGGGLGEGVCQVGPDRRLADFYFQSF